jgi:hypothetical protein
MAFRKGNSSCDPADAYFSGVWDGLSTQEAMEIYPDEWERFLADPYAHRAPRAESYHDLSGEWSLRTSRKSLQY